MQWPEAEWERLTEYVELSEDVATRIVGEPARSVRLLSSGKANSNYRVATETRTVVVRFHERNSDSAELERAVAELVAGHVPIAAWLASGEFEGRRFSVLDFVEGCHPHASSAPPYEIGFALGRGLRALENIECSTGQRVGLFAPDLSLAREFESIADSFVDLIEWSLRDGRARKRLGDLRPALRDGLDQAARQLEPLEQWRGIAHGDYKFPNLLVRHAELVAVLDWEFACAFTPMLDVAIHMRHREHFGDDYVRGFVAGHGELPMDWPRVSRILDLMNLVGFLNASGERPRLFASVRERISETLDLL